MERIKRESAERQVRLKAKYIRIQIWGMAICLSTPVAWVLVGMYRLQSIVPLLIVVLPYTGVIIFAIGTTLRQELKDNQDG